MAKHPALAFSGSNRRERESEREREREREKENKIPRTNTKKREKNEPTQVTAVNVYFEVILFRTYPTNENRVILGLNDSLGVEVRTPSVRNLIGTSHEHEHVTQERHTYKSHYLHIIFLEVGKKLFVQGLLERLVRFHDPIDIGIFLVKVVDHVGCLAFIVSEPEVRVVVSVRPDLKGVRAAFSEWW